MKMLQYHLYHPSENLYKKFDQEEDLDMCVHCLGRYTCACTHYVPQALPKNLLLFLPCS